jgi:UDP-N-acetylmuramate dehydrogenase
MSDDRELDLVARRLDGVARRDVALGGFTTYRVGGAAALFVDAHDVGVLRRVGEALDGTDVAVLVVGKGSNLLVADDGFDGVAVVLGDAFADIHIDGLAVEAGGAATLPVVARRTAAAGLSGFEWAVGVPGSIGGAVRMNAGGHGSDMAAVLVGVRVVELRGGETAVVPSAALELGYRHSNVSPTQVVVSASLELEPGDVAASQDSISEIVRWRRANQPGGQNAGSVFTNPEGDSAGRLIDAAGCKGLRVGSAEVSTKHANFIQSDEGGSADDVFALMAEVRRRVLDDSGVVLNPETHLVGFDPGLVLSLGGRPR